MARNDQDKARAFFRDIKRGDLGAVYLFTGEERFLVDRAVEEIRKRVFGDEEPDPFRYENLHGGDVDARRIIDSARTVTMFGGKRLIIVREVERLASNQITMLADHVENPGKWSHLVLTAFKIDGRKKDWKRITKAAQTISFKPLYQNQMAPWLRRQASIGHRLDLSHDAAAYLCEAIGTDMTLLERALEKLRLHVPEGGSVSAELARELVADTRERTVFELTDALMNRDLSGSLAALSSLIEQGEPLIKVGTMIARQIRLLMKLKAAQERGVSSGDLAQETGIHRFFLKDYVSGARRFEIHELVELHNSIYRADWRMKSSRLKANVILEEVVLQICQPTSHVDMQSLKR